MNLEETAAVLAKAAGYDNRTVGRANVLAWHEAIGDLRADECLHAVTLHHRQSDAYLMPVHVRRIAEKLRAERQGREAADGHRRELDAYAAHAGPLGDRSEEIQEFVHDVRDALPEGNVEALHPRREHWRREHTAFQRQAHAEPNPDWDPTMGPASSWQRTVGPVRGAWWENDADREADSRKILNLAGRLKRRRAADDAEAS